MSGGELFDYVVDKGTLSEVEASRIVQQITSAVAYLHARGIIHRDLKPGMVSRHVALSLVVDTLTFSWTCLMLAENLMLTSKSRGADVKIIDFGLAKLLDADDKTASFLGTRGYLAPEMLQRQAYSMSVDMWALGIIVYVLLCGCLPFDDDGAKIANDKAARVHFWSGMQASSVYADCVVRCRQSLASASRAGPAACLRAQRIYCGTC
jgi:serine/threonine protein kinase